MCRDRRSVVHFDMEMKWLMSKQFETLTKLISTLEKDFYGDWIFSKEGDGSVEKPFITPHVSFTPAVYELFSELSKVVKQHSEYAFNDYRNYLFKRGYISTKASSFPINELKTVPVENMDVEDVFVMLTAVQRADRFCEGVLLDFFKDGIIIKWLRRLEKIDE